MFFNIKTLAFFLITLNVFCVDYVYSDSTDCAAKISLFSNVQNPFPYMQWAPLIGESRAQFVSYFNLKKHQQKWKSPIDLAKNLLMGTEQRETLNFMIKDLEDIVSLAKEGKLPEKLKKYNFIKKFFRNKFIQSPDFNILINSLEELKGIKKESVLTYYDFLKAVFIFNDLDSRSNIKDHNRYTDEYLLQHFRNEFTVDSNGEKAPLRGESRVSFPDFILLPTHKKLYLDDLSLSFGLRLYHLGVTSHLTEPQADGITFKRVEDFLGHDENHAQAIDANFFKMSQEELSHVIDLHKKYLITRDSSSTRTKKLYQLFYFILTHENPDYLKYRDNNWMISSPYYNSPDEFSEAFADQMLKRIELDHDFNWLNDPQAPFSKEEIKAAIREFIEKMELSFMP